MPERVLADWPLKLLALALAFAIWVSITGQDRTLREVDVPLEIELGAERIADTPPPTAVKVRLEGPQRALRRLDPLRLAVRLDVRDAPLGRREIPITASHLTGVPGGVEVSLFDPDRVRLVLVPRARRELDIAPELVGRPADGCALYGVVVEPPTALVEGPQSAVDPLHVLGTEAIPLDGHRATFTAVVGLVPDDPLVRVLHTEEAEVQVLVDVAPVTQTFADLPVVLPFPAPSARLRPATVRVELSGPPWLLERLQPTQIAVVADATPPGQRGTQRVPLLVELRLPDDRKRLVAVKSVQPTHVTVQIAG